MEKRRVYQVAKEKKLSSDALISMLKSMDYEIRSHMSVVTEDMLEAITRKLEEEKKSSLAEVKRQKSQEEDRKKAVTQTQTEKQEVPPPKTTSAEKPSRRRGQARPSSSANAPAPSAPATNVPPKEGEDRRRPKRRGKREDLPVLGEPGAQAEKKETAPPAQSGDVSGRWKGGRSKRKRSVDNKVVQENVRKTLSQINEGRTRRRYDRSTKEEEEGVVEEVKILTVSEFITVAELAEHMEVRSTEVIATCLQLGMMVTINQRLDMDTIITVAEELGFEVRALDDQEDFLLEEPEEEEEEIGELKPRPSVVTVMGHVDHGKTSLLDYLRESNVAEGESGGITQHIGAYVVRMSDGRKITFLDTPGHAAFTAMRARGARITDLVILVVAADDNVMPQTIEAIDHAKAAQVPIVVAINKIDLPASDPDRIKRQLAERDVLLEDWGGQVACAEISAKTGLGIDKLLELVLLEAELLELKAASDKRARGTIIEAQLDKGRGAVATVLVQEGTLRRGDPFITGVFSGRVRALLDEHGQNVEEIFPSQPVQVLGLAGVPQAGDTFSVMSSERDAKNLSQRRQQMKREQEHRTIGAVSLSDLHYQIQQGQIKDLKVIVKGDVDGSVEAINQELGAITHEEVRVYVIHSGVGSISESDVLLAAASKAIIIGFGIQPDPPAREMALRDGVEIRLYEIIYEVIEEIRAGLSGLLSPDVKVRVSGMAQVRQVFRSSRAGSIAGCIIQQGKIARNNKVRLMRGGEALFEGDVASLRRFKDDVREVLEGYECGIGLEGFNDLQEGDIIEALEVIETARTL